MGHSRTTRPKISKINTLIFHKNLKLGLQHGSLEGVGGLKINEAYHSKADALLIPEMYFFVVENLPTPFFWKCLFYKIRPLFRFACATGYDTGGIRANGTSNAS